jgi:hypothetical protein
MKNQIEEQRNIIANLKSEINLYNKKADEILTKLVPELNNEAGRLYVKAKIAEEKLSLQKDYLAKLENDNRGDSRTNVCVLRFSVFSNVPVEALSIND